MKKTKIVCTIGPSCNNYSTLSQMARGGMDVARLNFSHSTHDEHLKNIALIRKVSDDLCKCISIIGDLQGPKIRVGKFTNGFVKIATGQEFTITTDDVMGNEHIVSTSFTRLPVVLKKGDKILLDDGELQMRIKGATKNEVICDVTVGGVLRDHKGINLPGITSQIEAMTEKDRADLEFAIQNGVDFIAVSFVRQASDIALVKEIIKKSGRSIPIIAKLEKPEAIKNLESIIEASDGVMVARGDLGVEMNPERLPILQKTIIRKANAMGKFVITATQMLDSMAEHPRPTRAEASDVANAIFDGSDALMLSRETASGEYPVKAVKMMTRIIDEVEKSKIWEEAFEVRRCKRSDSFSKTIANAAKNSAYEINAHGIAAFTMSGYTAKLISNVRPKTPIICFTPNENVVRELNIYWGVKPIKIDYISAFEEVITVVDKEIVLKKIAKKGDVVVVICGVPIVATGQTNLMKIHTIGG